VAQFERSMFKGPTRSFICAVVELPEERDSPKTVPNFSQGLPLWPRPPVAAVRSSPASPNSFVRGLAAPDGLRLSVVGPPPKTAASETLGGSATWGVQAEPVHVAYASEALPLWKL